MLDYADDDNYTEKIEKLVTMTVAAAKGIVPVGQVALPLAQIANGDLAPPEIRDFIRALSRILQGERDPLKLAEALTPELAEIMWDTLDQIDAPLPETGEAEPVGLTFEELIEKVAEACSGEVMLWQQLWSLTEQLSADENLPPDIRALGSVLRKILAGERQKFILDELAPHHRGPVEQLLDWLIAQAVTPER
ncbi:MAG: hypothetical protein DPW09_21000 [Anaerolineae bacterium]|nr:hypothetical protein [Anaerolineales bacterium]MCQ3975920.1 hypothetical protein [Anaerolineae bacterium]